MAKTSHSIATAAPVSASIPTQMPVQHAVISAWGKSTAVRIPVALVNHAGLQIGQKVRLESANDGSISIRPVQQRPQLDALLTRVTAKNLPDEADTDWGAPAGKEVW